MKTKRVRIAVAMTDHEEWSANGFFNWDDKTSHDVALQGLDDCPQRDLEAVYWIEADLPVPEPAVTQTIEGQVVE